MNRRTFLASTAGLAAMALATGCQAPVRGELILAMLAGSVPVQLIQAFQRQQVELGRVGVITKDSLVQLYALLQTWHSEAKAAGEASSGAASARPWARAQAPTPAHWVTQSDYWLAAAIQQELIQPIETQPLGRWGQLPSVWPQLVQRDRQGQPSSAGPVWGIPYRWTALAILYDARRLKGADTGFESWQALLQPALEGQLMVPDHPRLVVGLGLKALGASANGADPTAVKGLDQFLANLQGQVRWYDAEHTLKALIEGDALAVVGWVDTMLPVLKRYRHLRLAIPPEGTLASADLWVQPRGAQPPNDLAHAWLNFSLAEEFANQMAIYNQGFSPWLWGAAPDAWPEALRSVAQPLMSPGLLERSEFLAPLPAAAQAQYDALWQRMREG